MQKKHKTLILNILFVIVGLAILSFLYNAPPESTAPLPYDATHDVFRPMKKKEAEKHCEQCHRPDGEKPLPEDHPPKYRCLFCHKR